jgi:hypothetical protein
VVRAQGSLAVARSAIDLASWFVSSGFVLERLRSQEVAMHCRAKRKKNRYLGPHESGSN